MFKHYETRLGVAVQYAETRRKELTETKGYGRFMAEEIAVENAKIVFDIDTIELKILLLKRRHEQLAKSEDLN